MVDSSEKVGGARFNAAKAQEFRDWIASCRLIDNGFTGPKFTWFRGNIRERLDRSLCNGEWLDLFPSSITFHLERLKSDHRPILVRLSDEETQVRTIRPFRFNAAWLSHDDFKPMLDRSWQARKDLCVSLQVLEEDCRKWNTDVFGNIFIRKRKLSNRLRWLEGKNAHGNNPRFVAEEMEVRTELEKTLWQEEMLWLQKSRVKWNLEGDKNTRFFHLSTLRRRSSNHIKGLKDHNGQWVYEKERLSEMAIDHFKTLFSAGATSILQPTEADFSFPLSEAENRVLGRDLSAPEITLAIKSMGSLKAPGKDGFQPIFFQKCWNTVGGDVSDFLLNSFRYPELIEQVNQTIIVLIPKLLKPEQISQFRPISLCNVTYKLMAKCVADRLRSCMGNLVNETQTSFVPGRNITDNIIILQEVVHSMRSKSGKKGWMTIKLDLAKAFDRLEWSFVEDTLRRANIPENLVKIILCCISTTSTQVLWNGGLTPSFKPGRGLRQGCPLSPFLFTLCIERLSILIFNEINQGSWLPIKLAKDGPPLSHLFFADDLMLFGEASLSQCRSISKCHDRFCLASGQLVSLDKSRVFFSKNTQGASRRNICRSLGIAETTDLGRYLGVPVIHGRVRKDTFSYILERIDKKLDGWKRNTLSLAGCVTLAQSVLNSLPSYAMQTVALPASILNAIDCRIRRFVWGGSNDQRKIHLVSWDVICRPKSQGGLGLRKALELNGAFTMKLGWQLLKHLDKLWVRVLTSKYLKEVGGNIEIRRKN
ncbi:LINE-1 retrotransposable element ORF2 protein [Linum perenne]